MDITSTQTFDEIDKTLLTEAQRQFPVDHRPFEVLGKKLEISEQECLERFGHLKKRRMIRRLSAILDLQALGYQRSLVAMKVNPSRVDEAAGVISQYPGISHAAGRNDPFNLWFTIAVPPQHALEQIVSVLDLLVEAEETIILPLLRAYKTDVPIDCMGERAPIEPDETIYEPDGNAASKPQLTPDDIRRMRIIQEDLPLLELPFAIWAEEAEVSEEEFLAWFRKIGHLGYLRRFAAILKRRPSKFASKAMVVWQVPEDQVDSIAEEIVRFRQVSDCQRRPVYSSWPYPLFTTIHAQTHSGCMDAVKRIEEHVERFPHKNLFNTREYLSADVKYFAPEFEIWWKDVGSKAR